MITQVEFNTKSENPFYGMSNTLGIFQLASKGTPVSKAVMTDAWNECKDLNQKAVLISILFSIGDITGREHNMFESKVESGGNSQREVFRDTIIPFLNSVIKKRDRQKLMNLITEYTTMDNLLSNRVVTKKGSNQYLKTINMIDVFGIDEVAKYCAKIILKGSTFQKICVAKFLTRPRFSKRPGKTKMLEETKIVMARQAELLTKVSQLAKLHFEEKGSYINFDGYYQWRKQYNENSEAVLFSSGKIKDLDQDQFITWLDGLPSDARFRVRNRVKFGDKWEKLSKWYDAWEKFKVDAQTKQRELETKVDNGVASTKDIAKLKEVKKQAKVNVGANSFTQMFSQIVQGTVDEIKVQPFLDRVNLPYNNLLFMDDSASMSWNRGSQGFTPYQFAAFMATICMLKNPDPEAKNLLGLFAGNCRMINGVHSVNNAPNSLMRGQNIKTVSKPLIDTNKHFLQNLTSMTSWLRSACQNGSTNISAIPEGLNQWVNGDPHKLEELQRYPIWTLVSDGEFNNMRSPESSMLDFMKRCQNYFGFRPFIILIDVKSNTYGDSNSITRFSGIDNLMVIPPNPASIELFLTNFKDMDTFDVYTPLQSVYRSKRYAPIRNFIYETDKVKKAKKVTVLT